MRLQEAGFTLDEIAELRDAQAEDLDASLHEKHAVLEQQKRALIEKQRCIDSLMQDYQSSRDATNAGAIAIEELPARSVLVFPIDPTMRGIDANGVTNTHWDAVSQSVRATMVREGIPLSLYRKVGAIIPQKDILSSSPRARWAYVFADDTLLSAGESAQRLRTLEAGTYFTVYHKEVKQPLEASGLLEDLLRRIDESGFTIAGDYHDEVITDLPQFIQGEYDEIFKMSVRVAKVASQHQTNIRVLSDQTEASASSFDEGRVPTE